MAGVDQLDEQLPVFEGRAAVLLVAADGAEGVGAEDRVGVAVDVPQARQQVLDEIRAVNDILTSKATPEEAAAFRDWLKKAAQDAANAAKEGGFMGIGAERVSAGEQQMLDELDKVLA